MYRNRAFNTFSNIYIWKYILMIDNYLVDLSSPPLPPTIHF